VIHESRGDGVISNLKNSLSMRDNLAMDDRQIERIRGWQIATACARHGSKSWWAWGKMGQIQGSSPLSEPYSDVWIQYGATREEASRKLKEELGLS